MKLQEAIEGIDYHLWSSEPEVGKFIVALKRLNNFKNILEIGTFKGLTSCYILEDGKSDEGEFISIDIEDHRCDSVKKFFTYCNGTFILGDSLIKMQDLPTKSFDLIFLDSYHGLEQVRGEFKLAETLIKQNGLICIHDYFSSDGVPIFVDYLKEEQFKGNLRGLEIINLDTPEHRGFTIIKHLYYK